MRAARTYETAVAEVAAHSMWNIASDAVRNAADQFLGGEDLPKRLANQHNSRLLLVSVGDNVCYITIGQLMAKYLTNYVSRRLATLFSKYRFLLR